jgi:outer membrane protein OmpA-like peptidoglycan-associated protein
MRFSRHIACFDIDCCEIDIAEHEHLRSRRKGVAVSDNQHYKQRCICSVFVVLSLWWCVAAAQAQEFDLSPGKKVIVKDSVFKQGSEKFEVASVPLLTGLAKYLAERPQLEIEIDGHADNSGSEAQNYALSLARAETVKRFLVERGIAPFRITTRGFGSQIPIASNATPVGQSQNRRVEVIGLTPISRRPLTNERNQALPADGAITAIQRNVTLIAPWTPDWLQARLRQPVYEYSKINTQAESRSEITFNDQSTIHVGENALVVLYGGQRSAAPAYTKENVELVQGSLLVKLKKLRAQDSFAIRTKSSQMAFEQGKMRIATDEHNRSLLSVFQGGANVRMVRGGAVTELSTHIPENHGILVNAEGTVAATYRLAAPPELVEPKEESIAARETTRFVWRTARRDENENGNRNGNGNENELGTGGALSGQRTIPVRAVRFEVSDDSTFTRLVYGVVTDAQQAAVKLPAGVYYFRLSSVDSLGLESPPLERVLRVERRAFGVDMKFLAFRSGEFLLLVGAAACGWMGVLLRRVSLRWIAAGLFAVAMVLFWLGK